VRISPYDAQARRHTSFASVFLYPDIDDTIEVDLREEDIRMDVYRASGAGGQHVNKTLCGPPDHIPTRRRQQERSGEEQGYRLNAARRLYKEKAESRRRRAAWNHKTDNFWGNQIRSSFSSRTMVHDHRTEGKVGDVQR
jgi:peptide chain release factor 2